MGVAEDNEMLSREIKEYEKRIIQSKSDHCEAIKGPAIAEFIGCMVMTFFSCGIMMSQARLTRDGNMQFSVGASTKEIGNYALPGALGMGMTYAVCHFIFGHISGGHFNCAVTLSLVSLKKVSIIRWVAFFIMQLLGCLVGGAFLMSLAADIRVVDRESAWQGYMDEGACYGANWSNAKISGINEGQVFLLELMGGFFLLLVYNAVSDYQRSQMAFSCAAIGFAYFVYALVAIPINGASLNPTRSLASAVMSSTVDLNNGAQEYMCPAEIFSQMWIYWIGPPFGGILASQLWEQGFSADRRLVAKLDTTFLHLKKKAEGGEDTEPIA